MHLMQEKLAFKIVQLNIISFIVPVEIPKLSLSFLHGYGELGIHVGYKNNY